MTENELRARIAQYKWYHCIELAPGIRTPGGESFNRSCDFIQTQTADIDFHGRSVLDVGARDGLHSVRAAQRGAESVVAIDNDRSAGACELVFPLLAPKVEYRHQNLFALQERDHFDIVQFFGVLYHLRFPFQGLHKMAQVAKIGGLILIEGGMLVLPKCEDMAMLFCPPPERSPYDPSSVTFFNRAGLDAAMHSFGCERIRPERYWEPSGEIRRGFFVYQKRENVNHGYWEGLHSYHTRSAHAHSDWTPDTP